MLNIKKIKIHILELILLPYPLANGVSFICMEPAIIHHKQTINTAHSQCPSKGRKCIIVVLGNEGLEGWVKDERVVQDRNQEHFLSEPCQSICH